MNSTGTLTQKFKDLSLKMYSNYFNHFRFPFFQTIHKNLFQLDEFTMCFRLMIYQYPADDTYPFVLVHRFLEIFGSVGAYGTIYRDRIENQFLAYDNKNIVVKVIFSTMKLYRGWPPGMWHNLCITYNKNKKNLQLIVNGETVADIIYDTSAEKPHLNQNIM